MSVERGDQLLIRAEQAYQAVTADPREGWPRASRVAADARQAGAGEALVVALRAAGWAARELYDHDAAGRCLHEAVRIARAAGLRDRLAEALITRATMHLETGHAARAQRDLAEAERVATRRTRPEVTFADGLFHDIVGDVEEAIAAYRRVLSSRDGAATDLRFKTLNNLGLLTLRLGRYDEAERLLGDAERLAETFSPAFAGFAAESRARAAFERGQLQEALRRYERAERKLTAVGVQLTDLYLGKASAFLQLRLLDEAASAAHQAVSHVDGRSGGSLMLAEALLPYARIALERGDLDDAAAAAARAETLFRRQRRTGWRARASLLRTQVEYRRQTATPAMADRLARIERAMRDVGNMPAASEASLLHGQVAAALGRSRRACAALDRAAKAARGLPVLVRLRGRLATAMKADLEGDTRRVSQTCRVGLQELDRYRATFASAELRARAAAHGASLADLALRAAVRSGRTESIWGWMERSRATVTLREGSSEPDGGLDPDLTLLRSLERDLVELAPDDAAEQSRLLRRITQLEHRIRNREWQQRSARPSPITPSVASLRALRSDLRERALLQYAVLDGRLIGAAVTATAIRVVDLGPPARVESCGRQLGFALRRLSAPRSRSSVQHARASARHELETIADILIAPLEDTIRDSDEIIVVPTPALIGIPWGALAPVADRPVRAVPTATLWRITRDRKAKSDDVVLVAGPDLPSAPAEVSSIASCYDSPRVLTGPGATTEQVRAALTGARTAHLACHGRLRRDAAAFSSLRLTDGPLTVRDLEHLPMSAHHWILAACDLGSPGHLVGPELDGVVATLLLGGAAGVVAAIVSVPDAETSGLMTDLHRELASGATLAQALQRARHRADVDDPAGFVASVAFSCYGGG